MENDNKSFWQRFAKLYSPIMEKSSARLYRNICDRIRPELNRQMNVLELACGTGQLSYPLSGRVRLWEATDFSEAMIAEAKKKNTSRRLHFSVQDMFRLPYADRSFDVIIVSNALHIVPEPEKALSEIRRVLKDDGVLVAPTFTHADNAFFGKVKAFFMKLAGFPLHSKWTSNEYLAFLQENGWTVRELSLIHISEPTRP